MSRVRFERDDFLNRCDWTIASDSPFSESDQNDWKTYRTALRNVPATYSGTDPQLVRFTDGGSVQVGSGIESGTTNLTGDSIVIAPPSDIFSDDENY